MAKADNMRAAFGEQADRNCRGRAAEEGAGQVGRESFLSIHKFPLCLVLVLNSVTVSCISTILFASLWIL